MPLDLSCKSNERAFNTILKDKFFNQRNINDFLKRKKIINEKKNVIASYWNKKQHFQKKLETRILKSHHLKLKTLKSVTQFI